MSLKPTSSTLRLAATEKTWMPWSRAPSAAALMPPQGLPVTWPSVMTTEKSTALVSEAWRVIWCVMFRSAQSM